MKKRKCESNRDIVVVDRIRVQMNCWMRDHRLSPTRRCKGTAHTSAGVCCRETRCIPGRRFQSTDDDTPTVSCCPLRLYRNLQESFQCFRTARTRHKYLSHQQISDVDASLCVVVTASKLLNPNVRNAASFGEYRHDAVEGTMQPIN